MASFFQIILNSTFQERKLKLPNKFVREHGNELFDTVRLSIPTGCCWDVKVKKDDDGTIWLHDGLFEFMEENSIGRTGYSLLLKYEGNSKLSVHIFDFTATEIMYSCRSDSKRFDVGSSHETTGARRIYLTRRKKQIIEGRIDANGSMRSGPGSNSSPKDIETKTATQPKKIYPMAPNFFRVTLKLYHITNGMLRVPCSFARAYMSSSTAPMKLVDADNKEWEVVHVHPPHREHDYVLSKGWKKFVRAKGLMVEDICVFKHIEGTEEVKLKVNIFRLES